MVIYCIYAAIRCVITFFFKRCTITIAIYLPTSKYIDRAIEVSDYTGRMEKECFLYAVRKDRRKFSRAYSLLRANEELKAVQKVEYAKQSDQEIPAEETNINSAAATDQRSI